MAFVCSDSIADLEKYPYHIRDVHISDPFIYADPVTKHYFTYVQFADYGRFPELKPERGVFYVLESEDLIHWTRPAVCFRREESGFEPDLDYWAPELHFWQGRYYLFSTFRAEGTFRRCQCLRADSPRGPFSPFGPGPVTPEGWQCLDGTLYTDRKGMPWMVFVHEWLQVGDGQICAVPLTEDLSEAAGEPKILFRASDGLWNGKSRNGGYVTDGPFLYRLKSGRLIMLWSSFTDKGAYGIGLAHSASGEIGGPWIQHENPVYAMDGGHAMLFHTFSGQLMMACHCPNDHPRKRILLFEMEETDTDVRVINEVTGNWFAGVGGPGKDYAICSGLKEVPVFSADPRYRRREEKPEDAAEE